MIAALPHTKAGADVLELWNRWEAELPPGGREISLAELQQRFLHPGGQRQRHDWFVWRDDTGTARGLAHLELWFDNANPELAECEIFVDPDLRRRGVGRRLPAHLLDAGEAERRSSLISWGPRTGPSAGFWETLGPAPTRRAPRRSLPRHR